MKIKKAKRGRPAMGEKAPDIVRKNIKVKAEIWEQLQELSEEHDASIASLISQFLENGIKQIQEAK
jgi:macrodomain Ter protein organizer (MatP/YcbG family)